ACSFYNHTATKYNYTLSLHDALPIFNVTDPVAKYLPEFAALKTPSGKPANLTITQILTHTSGLGEASAPDAQKAKTLADLVPLRSEEHTSELQSLAYLVCRLLLEKKK